MSPRRRAQNVHSSRALLALPPLFSVLLLLYCASVGPVVGGLLDLYYRLSVASGFLLCMYGYGPAAGSVEHFIVSRPHAVLT